MEHSQGELPGRDEACPRPPGALSPARRSLPSASPGQAGADGGPWVRVSSGLAVGTLLGFPVDGGARQRPRLKFAQPPPCLEQPLRSPCLTTPGRVSSGLPGRSVPPAPVSCHLKHTCCTFRPLVHGGIFLFRHS